MKFQKGHRVIYLYDGTGLDNRREDLRAEHYKKTGTVIERRSGGIVVKFDNETKGDAWWYDWRFRSLSPLEEALK